MRLGPTASLPAHTTVVVKTSRFMKSDQRFDGLITIVPFVWERTILPPRLNYLRLQNEVSTIIYGVFINV